MHLSEIWQEIIGYTSQINYWELTGLVTGLLAVFFLIKESIWTWPSGIVYVLVSFCSFLGSSLIRRLLLHVFFLVLNIYGWTYWIKGRNSHENSVLITQLSLRQAIITIGTTMVGIFVFARILISVPNIFEGVDSPALPYWDSTTSVLSVTGMWLTARKKIDNWYYWFAVDVLATGIYLYKELYFYSLLYLIYIGMAVAGYLAWKKTMMLNLKGI